MMTGAIFWDEAPLMEGQVGLRGEVQPHCCLLWWGQKRKVHQDSQAVGPFLLFLHLKNGADTS